MRKVRLIVLKTQIENLVKELHEAGLIDIRKSAYEGLESGRPLASFDEISAELLKLRTILSIMESAGGKAPAHEPTLMDGKSALSESRMLQIGEKLKELNAQSSAMAERLKSLESEALLVEKVLHFKNVDFSGLSTRTLDFRLGSIPGAKLGRMREALEGKNTRILYEPGFSTVLVMFERKSKADVEIILSDLGFAEMELPAGMTTPMEAIDRIRSESDSVSASLAAIKKEMDGISKKSAQHVRSLIRSLEVEAERAEVASRFGSSKRLYVLEGWILENSLEDLHEMLEKHTEVMVQDVHYGHDETPPTVLDNPRVAGPMEFITKNYSLPNYFELDPTMAYFIALPILYGMIVGDVI
ncbi:MAG: V-type ATPase 116kDa subunit family protein, partial [Candidatus Micrarchaeota archaeon]